ncbi:gamma-glutamyl phosphate reductase [Candidatus Protofrankia californiensis]|uniref:Gamma-glutamyl phosphate reductase n=1 Tax=Candidatus Protofrankia californiensis TaxID=1839754 RepID=A0A1C3NWY8_9ACTN|nr:gamma-glutamyl phosphate reductase [Candidatus Protofrankia californiensis]
MTSAGPHQRTDRRPQGDDALVASDAVVAGYGRLAAVAAESLAEATNQQITAALDAMAERLTVARAEIVEANERDLRAAEKAGMSVALLDRLLLGQQRIDATIAQLRLLAAVEVPPREIELRELPDGLRLVERRRPVGVIGANFEARPGVTIDVASQLLKSRNAGVLRTGSAALSSALALHRHVIVPALRAAYLDSDAIQLVEEPGHEFASALVRQRGLIKLVILRGSGETTAALGAEAARYGVRTLAHADGGGVLYVDAAADRDTVVRLLRAGTDRLGVCNRVNLVLIADAVYDTMRPVVENVLRDNRIRVSLPPHGHPLGYEWALDPGNEATVTVAPVGDAREAARVANTETSGLAATVVTEDAHAAATFMDSYSGTGVFWNATTRLLDGFKLHAIPETGINVDHVPGPRGPVTFADLYLRQYLVLPATAVLS